MKIGIISDIHAYLEPLQKALALRQARKVDQIVCNGDLIEGGIEGDGASIFEYKERESQY